jgi:NAD-specific glutamate dehydrogenase
VGEILAAGRTESDGEVDVDALVAHGVDRSVASEFGALGRLYRVADLAATSRALGRSVNEVDEAFGALDAELGLVALEGHLRGLEPGSRWERWQARALFDDVGRLRRQAAEAAMAAAPDSPPAKAMADWVGAQPARVQRFQRLAGRIEGRDSEALCVAALAVRALSDLVEQR